MVETRNGRCDSRVLRLEGIARVHLDFDSYTKYVSYFLVDTNNTVEACIALVENPQWALSVADRLEFQPRFTIEPQPHSTELPFSRRVFIYCEHNFSEPELTPIYERAKELEIVLCIRDPAYAERRAASEKALAFISHDSHDKDRIARPLAIELARRGCPVWFDEYSLRVGTSLRESIERGIKECSKCVLIISRNFLDNRGWTKTEFNSIFTRELLEKSNYMLPVWVDVSRQDVYDYCSSLADKVAVKWTEDVREVSRRLSIEILSNEGDSSSYNVLPPSLKPR